MNPHQAMNIITENMHLTLATSTRDGKPWNTPLFFAYDQELSMYWNSEQQAQHSQNIKENEHVFIVIYGSKSEGIGVYIQATAKEITATEEMHYVRKLIQQRKGKEVHENEQAHFTGSSRYYKATPQKIWINAMEKRGDFIRDYRVELSKEELKKHFIV